MTDLAGLTRALLHQALAAQQQLTLTDSQLEPLAALDPELADRYRRAHAALEQLTELAGRVTAQEHSTLTWRLARTEPWVHVEGSELGDFLRDLHHAGARAHAHGDHVTGELCVSLIERELRRWDGEDWLAEEYEEELAEALARQTQTDAAFVDLCGSSEQLDRERAAAADELNRHAHACRGAYSALGRQLELAEAITAALPGPPGGAQPVLRAARGAMRCSDYVALELLLTRTHTLLSERIAAADDRQLADLRLVAAPVNDHWDERAASFTPFEPADADTHVDFCGLLGR